MKSWITYISVMLSSAWWTKWSMMDLIHTRLDSEELASSVLFFFFSCWKTNVIKAVPGRAVFSASRHKNENCSTAVKLHFPILYISVLQVLCVCLLVLLCLFCGFLLHLSRVRWRRYYRILLCFFPHLSLACWWRKTRKQSLRPQNKVKLQGY